MKYVAKGTVTCSSFVFNLLCHYITLQAYLTHARADTPALGEEAHTHLHAHASARNIFSSHSRNSTACASIGIVGPLHHLQSYNRNNTSGGGFGVDMGVGVCDIDDAGDAGKTLFVHHAHIEASPPEQRMMQLMHSADAFHLSADRNNDKQFVYSYETQTQGSSQATETLSPFAEAGLVLSAPSSSSSSQSSSSLISSPSSCSQHKQLELLVLRLFYHMNHKQPLHDTHPSTSTSTNTSTKNGTKPWNSLRFSPTALEDAHTHEQRLQEADCVGFYRVCVYLCKLRGDYEKVVDYYLSHAQVLERGRRQRQQNTVAAMANDSANTNSAEGSDKAARHGHPGTHTHTHSPTQTQTQTQTHRRESAHGKRSASEAVNRVCFDVCDDDNDNAGFTWFLKRYVDVEDDDSSSVFRYLFALMHDRKTTKEVRTFMHSPHAHT